ncbi:MAG: hypothetical protein SNJ67_09380 [Chloracidobacterium sp.]|uniref:Uncharacterized protein n=1 Tax=Chloracidobacterium validum TaxID=2821543 RepID=A0ABX8BHR5_9BACT|nr:hypothetical protein [Chloracidobacterium validum]QUW04605.1 hypothetical protein J8C06_12545 [Chloracidobacterium validum]
MSNGTGMLGRFFGSKPENSREERERRPQDERPIEPPQPREESAPHLRSFESIYQSARLPVSPCGVDELEKMIANPIIANAPPETRVIALKFALDREGHTIEEPKGDAARKVKALDAYHGTLLNRADSLERRNADRFKEMEAERLEFIRRQEEEKERLMQEAQEAEQQAREFEARLNAERQRLSDLLRPFVGELDFNDADVDSVLSEVPPVKGPSDPSAVMVDPSVR